MEPWLPPMSSEDEMQRRGRILGAMLVIGGAYMLVRSTELFTMLLAERGLGVLLILGGLAVLLLRAPRRR